MNDLNLQSGIAGLPSIKPYKEKRDMTNPLERQLVKCHECQSGGSRKENCYKCNGNGEVLEPLEEYAERLRRMCIWAFEFIIELSWFKYSIDELAQKAYEDTKEE